MQMEYANPDLLLNDLSDTDRVVEQMIDICNTGQSTWRLTFRSQHSLSPAICHANCEKKNPLQAERIWIRFLSTPGGVRYSSTFPALPATGSPAPGWCSIRCCESPIGRLSVRRALGLLFVVIPVAIPITIAIAIAVIGVSGPVGTIAVLATVTRVGTHAIDDHTDQIGTNVLKDARCSIRANLDVLFDT